MEEIFEETCLQMDAELIEFGGEDDHVHLMVCCPPKLAASNLVGKLKGKSSYFIRQEYWPQIKNKLWGAHLWSPSYCLVSCGGSSLEAVKQYIAEQRKPPSPRSIRKSLELTGKKRHVKNSR